MIAGDYMTPLLKLRLESLVDCLKRILGQNLVGIYLHGSLAMACYNPNSSDIDFIVIVRHDLDDLQKRHIVKGLIKLENDFDNITFEMSVVRQDVVNAGSHPLDFILHYSKLHKRNFTEAGLLCENAKDPDLVTHLAFIKERGKCLYGKPIGDLGIEYSKSDYIDSILNDIKDTRQVAAADPVSAVLNLCRTLEFLEKGTLSSKREGGDWYVQCLTGEDRQALVAVMAAYSGKSPVGAIETRCIERLIDTLMAQIEATLSKHTDINKEKYGE